MDLLDVVSDFQLPATSGLVFQLSRWRGKKLVLYFYPKDATPGCTTQGMQFRDNYADFQALNTDIFGISRDSINSHENFKAKFSFPFELLSDSTESVCTLFSVIKTKSMYGKTVRGIERSTFVIDEAGILRYAERGVKVEAHAAKILAVVRQLQA